MGDEVFPEGRNAIFPSGCERKLNFCEASIKGRRSCIFQRERLQRALIRMIDAYQFLVSPWTYGRCRFFPTCSVYAKEAIQEYGILRGLCLSVFRLLRCHPACKGGVDEVKSRRCEIDAR